MVKKIFIVAGNYEEFKYFTRKHNNLSVELICVHHADSLRGRRDIYVQFTDYGRERKDILDIYNAILMCNLGGKYENATRALRLDLLLYA